MSTEAFAICSISILPIPPTPFAIYFGISISILLLCGKCSRKTLNCRHLLAENNSCAFMRIESIRKCQCINILLRSLSFLPYTLWVWQYGLYMATEHFVLFSPSLWGWEKLCQLCLGSTCSTAMYLHLHLHFHCGRQRCAACPSVWQWATKNAQDARGRQRKREEEKERPTVFLIPCAADSTVLQANMKLQLQSCQTCFLPNETEMKCLLCGVVCFLLVVRVACHIVEPNIMTILRAGLKEPQAEQIVSS